MPLSRGTSENSGASSDSTQSALQWSQTAGGWTILVPRYGSVRIQKDFQIRGRINGVTLTGVRNTLEEALKAAEEQIRRRVDPVTFRCLQRPTDRRPMTTISADC